MFSVFPSSSTKTNSTTKGRKFLRSGKLSGLSQRFAKLAVIAKLHRSSQSSQSRSPSSLSLLGSDFDNDESDNDDLMESEVASFSTEVSSLEIQSLTVEPLISECTPSFMPGSPSLTSCSASFYSCVSGSSESLPIPQEIQQVGVVFVEENGQQAQKEAVVEQVVAATPIATNDLVEQRGLCQPMHTFRVPIKSALKVKTCPQWDETIDRIVPDVYSDEWFMDVSLVDYCLANNCSILLHARQLQNLIEDACYAASLNENNVFATQDDHEPTWCRPEFKPTSGRALCSKQKRIPFGKHVFFKIDLCATLEIPSRTNIVWYESTTAATQLDEDAIEVLKDEYTVQEVDTMRMSLGNRSMFDV